MALKPFWNKKHHLKLTPDELDKKFLFEYGASNGAGTDKLSIISLENKGDDKSRVWFNFKDDGDAIYLADLSGEGWAIRNNFYNIPITQAEGQTLLTTRHLTQNIDYTEYTILRSPLIVKYFAGFIGTLNYINAHVFGVVYEPTLTQKVYFISIELSVPSPSEFTAEWTLIPLT